jgi:hypothetical protein
MKATFSNEGEEHISLATAKAWLQVDENTDDQVISRLIKSVRKHLENSLGISIVTKTVTLEQSGLWFPYRLPFGPVLSVASLQFDGVDYSGNTDVLKDEYVYRPASLVKNTITAVYNVGHEDLPEDLEQLILDMLRIHYDSRGLEVMPIPEHVREAMNNYNRNLFI